MNERITELLIESDLMESIGVYAYEEDGWEPIVKRFAELIVKECAKISIGDDPDFMAASILEDGVRRIYKHFGVK